MNGVVLLIGALLLLMMLKLLIAHDWIGLILFFFVLYLVFGISQQTRQTELLLYMSQDGIDQSSINKALANKYAAHIAANEHQVEQAMEFKARLYKSLISGTITKEE